MVATALFEKLGIPSSDLKQCFDRVESS